MNDSRPEFNRVLITGGCGFIGSNLAKHYLQQGRQVVVFDNFSRRGADANAAWLADQQPDGLSIVVGDVRNFDSLREAVHGCELVVHLAAQSAVGRALDDPREDFQINLVGSFNVLEAARASGSDPIVIYASTHQAYGSLSGLELNEHPDHYAFRDRDDGIPETFPIDLYSPHSCSKGAADLYTLSYARSYGLRTVVFRLSSICGPRHLAAQDQDWAMHYVISTLLEHSITIHGDGKQVRDLLQVRDLIGAFDRAAERIEVSKGQAYNIGGGPTNAVSHLQLADQIRSELGLQPELRFQNRLPWDQKVYISDIRKAERELGWMPRVDWISGLSELYRWARQNRGLFAKAGAETGHPQATRPSEPSPLRSTAPHATPLERLSDAERAARRVKEITGEMKAAS